jgi:hypothetical protein
VDRPLKAVNELLLTRGEVHVLVNNCSSRISASLGNKADQLNADRQRTPPRFRQKPNRLDRDFRQRPRQLSAGESADIVAAWA